MVMLVRNELVLHALDDCHYVLEVALDVIDHSGEVLGLL